MKFPQGEGSAVIHRKKNRPALQSHDILTIFVVFVVVVVVVDRGMCSSIQLLVVLFFLAFYTAPFSSKHFFSGLFLRSLSTQLFFFVVLLLFTTMSMTAFSYVGLLSLQSVTLSRCFPERLSSEQFAELESVHLLAFWARACSLPFLYLLVSFLAISRAVVIYLVLFSGLY